jgi:hypothetical protein
MDCTTELRNEIEELKAALKSLEERIIRYEDNDKFNPNDIRYTRLVDEKRILLQNLCELRAYYGQQCNFQLATPSSSSAAQIFHENGFSQDLPSAKRQKLNNSKYFC